MREEQGLPLMFDSWNTLGDELASVNNMNPTLPEKPEDVEAAAKIASKKVIKDIVAFFIVAGLIEAGARMLGQDNLPGPSRL
ncbi:hypothetical protein M514_02616 [Trichuris suis]|uniref:Uncharacterized protein n=1 Tax=Trichuris suis TaxID=68888 RepID=A0A085NNJ5_9BILA|nr:hypothetical protein M513_02616 [Trichuris suis]KFD71041.1 hypothetical protein M514_02616 [Trichuris suis]KHJ48622.1 hypothetical protein D918_00924 [Trichuris suis]